MEETTDVWTPEFADERSGRADSPCPITNNRPSECQAEKYSHATGIPAHEYGNEEERERLLRRVLIKPKIPQDKLMECEIDKTASAHKAIRGVSAQQIIILLEYNNHGYAKQQGYTPEIHSTKNPQIKS